MPITLEDIQTLVISGTVANYSALPAANTVPDQYYWVLAEQGTWWLPGSLGGTYYNKGIYRSNGTIWEFQATPANATQAAVDAGTNNDQFVTPLTLTNSSQLAAKASLTGAETLTNKTIKKRILVVTQSATPSTNIDDADIVQITGQASAITSMTSGLSGTPYDGQMIMWQITDNGTARSITWGASFASTTGATLPTTTVISTMLRVITQYNSVTSKHECQYVN